VHMRIVCAVLARVDGQERKRGGTRQTRNSWE
jgi:hypothetical protein